ncbi:MAG: hypothetical protein KF819_33335 [Labilithrix sp.]|nr:hypothetical protein [Labilithrix sp.]
MTPPIDPMAPEIDALLSSERSALDDAPPGKARVRARLEKTLFGAPPPGGDGGGPTTTSTSAGANAAAAGAGAKIIAAFIAGALAGGAVVFALMPPKVQAVEYMHDTHIAPSVTPASAAPPVEGPPASAAPAASASTPPAGSAPRGDSLAAERALLDPARTALGRRDAASALDAVRKHETKFAQGKMSEEREAIAVQALVLAGKRPEAEARAARFRQRYPGSVLLAAVEAALGHDEQ